MDNRCGTTRLRFKQYSDSISSRLLNFVGNSCKNIGRYIGCIDDTIYKFDDNTVVSAKRTTICNWFRHWRKANRQVTYIGELLLPASNRCCEHSTPLGVLLSLLFVYLISIHSMCRSLLSVY